jgi:UTP--glucose-1-phosphate uridylyltransferase
VPNDRTASYGIVSVEKEPSGVQRIDKIIEKPEPEEAPSNLAVVGRYLLTPAIFEQLEGRGPGAGGEIQLTDGIAGVLRHEPVHALLFEGTRYDCGSRLGYLKATVEYGLHNEEVGARFQKYLKELTKKI